MNLIALIIGLFLERLVTHLLHLREPRWLDAYFDWGLARSRNLGAWLQTLAVIAIILLPVLPVLLVAVGFRDVLNELPYLLFAILLLIFSLGPRDLQQEVRGFCEARGKGDEEEIGRSAKELTESNFPRDPGERELAVEEAVLFQAVNRIFAVVFWFMVVSGHRFVSQAQIIRSRAPAGGKRRSRRLGRVRLLDTWVFDMDPIPVAGDWLCDCRQF